MKIEKIISEVLHNGGFKTKKNLAEFLGIDPSAINQWLRQGNIPERHLNLIEKFIHAPHSTDTYTLPRLTIKASAGHGTDLISVDEFDTGETMVIDKSFFKTKPKANLKVIQVDGYSMIPMLLPDSFVIFEETYKLDGDGLYVINYSNQLMVKLLQITPDGKLAIISKNKDYKSFELNFKENNEFFKIIGKVIKCIL